MKKALLCGLSAALLLALVLVACNKPQADQPEPPPTPSAVQTQPEETNEPVNQVEQMSINTQQEVDTPREATLMDLLDLFQTVYDCRADWISLGETEEVLELLELEEVNVQVEANRDVIYPADIQNQYLTWKAIYYGTTEPVLEEQQQATDMAENSTTTTTTTQTGATASTAQQAPTTTPAPAQTETPASGGDSGTGGPGGTGGGLALDVTGGKSPMDFMNREDIGTEARDNSKPLDMSKVGFGE